MSQSPFPYKHSYLEGPVSRIAQQPPQLVLSSGRFCPSPLPPMTPALKIRTVMYLEKKTLTLPITYQHPCLSFLLPPNSYHPCSLCQARLKETRIDLSLPSSQVPFPPLAQILGQFNPKEAEDWWVSLCLSRASVAIDSLRLSVKAGLIVPQ